MEKPEIRPLTIQKWLNRSSLNFAWVTTSKSPITTQNFITIRSGIFQLLKLSLLGFFFSFFWFLAERCKCIASSAIPIRCCQSSSVVCRRLSLCDASILWHNGWSQDHAVFTKMYPSALILCLTSLILKFEGVPLIKAQTAVGWFSIEFTTLYLGNGVR